MVSLAIFDFDGTLADSFAFFLSVFNELAARHGFRAVDPQEVPALRRLGARELMQRVGMPARKLPAVTRDFIGLMRKDRASVRLFEGVEDVLHELHARGVALGVVSSNSRDNVLHVLGSAARAVRYLECGVSIFGKRARLRRVLRKSQIEKASALYIGDQPTDLEAARAEGVAFGAVAWGYGDMEALRGLRPEREFLRVADLLTLA
ncbi:MAG TPA: HAD hydrolase-like protein [Burkholderiales bacterium]|nr:HAD hydrolase-like protein [Burkholderiales bacterium]